MEQNKKFNLSDLMTAAQAQKIIDMLENLDKRVSTLENCTTNLTQDVRELQFKDAVNTERVNAITVDVMNINHNVRELMWQDTYNHVAAMFEEAYPGCITNFDKE